MKTTALAIENLCVPCRAHCRYCLLSSNGVITGIDYERGKQLAERLIRETREWRNDFRCFYYIGYCMDSEHLMDYIRFSQIHEGPSARFLQMNGFSPRTYEETLGMMKSLRHAGIELIDITLYGTEEYHDRFAGRVGDFDYLIRILNTAEECGLKVHISCPIHKENLTQAEALLRLLGDYRDLSFFLPHGKGRGCTLNHLRLDISDYATLSSKVKERLGVCETEGELIAHASEYAPQNRTLTLVLKPENIETLEQMDAKEIIRYLEELDDQYYHTIPPVEELAALYGSKRGVRMYRRFRDLYLEWQQMFLLQQRRAIWDMNDETHHFSVRV